MGLAEGVARKPAHQTPYLSDLLIIVSVQVLLRALLAFDPFERPPAITASAGHYWVP